MCQAVRSRSYFGQPAPELVSVSQGRQSGPKVEKSDQMRVHRKGRDEREAVPGEPLPE